MEEQNKELYTKATNRVKRWKPNIVVSDADVIVELEMYIEIGLNY